MHPEGPQCCESTWHPLLNSLFTHDCVAKHNSNTIIKFAEDTTVVAMITDDDETVYRWEVRDLAVWYQDNNLYLNFSKTKELIVDYRKHALIHINGAVVEWVESFKFIGFHITNQLSWSKHTKTVMKRTRQSLFPLRRLKRLAMGPQILKTFYSCTIESTTTGCITAWYGNCSASERKALQRVVRTTQYILGAKLPATQDLYNRRCQRQAPKNVKDSSHPSHRLFSLLPHCKWYRSAKSRTKMLLNSFTPKP